MEETAPAQEAPEGAAPSDGKSLKKTALALGLGLFLFALIIRLLGINWGLPDADHNYSYHPDEFVTWSASQQIDPAKGDFTPSFYNYGTLYLTMLNVGTSMTQAYGGGPKSESGTDQLQAIGNYHRTGRIISALAGAAMALIVFLMLYRRTTLLGAAFGALAIGLAPALVVHSRFQSVDVLGATLAAASLLFSTRLLAPLDGDSGDWKFRMKLAIWAGVFAGLSAGTKYNGGLAFLGLLPLFWPLKVKDAAKLIGVAFGAAALAFLISTPGFLFESAKFWEDFSYELRHSSEGHGLVFVGTSPGFLYHIGNLAYGYGALLLVLGVVGLVMAIRARQTWIYGLALFAIIFYLLIGRAEIKFMRYVFPLIPVLAAAFGWWVGTIQQKGGTKGRLGVVAGIFALGGILGGGATWAMVATGWMSGLDPRDEALAWLRANAADSRVGFASDPWYYSVPTFPDAGEVRRPLEGRLAKMERDGRPATVVHVTDGAVLQFDPALLTEDKPDYVVFSSFESDDLKRMAEQGRTGEDIDRYTQFFKTLGQFYESSPVAEFGTDGPSIHDMMYIRPKVWIWKRKTDSGTTSNGSSTGSEASGAPVGTPSTPTDGT
jgi:hypothetical protein